MTAVGAEFIWGSTPVLLLPPGEGRFALSGRVRRIPGDPTPRSLATSSLRRRMPRRQRGKLWDVLCDDARALGWGPASQRRPFRRP